jgi:hypothetical protein
MKTKWMCIFLILFMLFSLEAAHGYYSYGARAVAMGGAYTGLANDGSLFYWNPGSLSGVRGWVIEMQYGQDNLFADDVRSIMDSMKNWYDQGDLGRDDLQRGMTRLSEKDWLYRGGDTMSFIIAHRSMSMFFNQQQIYYIQHSEDDFDLSDDPSSTGSGSENNLHYELSGIDLKEYGITFSLMGGDGGFSLGLTGKYIRATGYHSIRNFRDISSAQPDYLKDMIEKGDRESGSSWGMDAGIIMTFGTSRFGITGRNIRKYSIDVSENVSIVIKPEYRIGYAYQPGEHFVFSVDYTTGKEYDILGNNLDGREMAAGFEGVFGQKKWLILRSGISMPLDGDAPMVISLGTGLSFDSGILDIGYAFDQKRDSQKLWFGLKFMFQ